uniref:Oxidored_FMN domain-containing protein n=1 Tax=Ascaris lumbricoides TaxID=6252 RepID=A0A0M3HK97_ASCLU
MYYLRTRPAVDAVQFTVDKTRLKEVNAKMLECALSDPEGCVMCSSNTSTYESCRFSVIAKLAGHMFLDWDPYIKELFRAKV